MANETIYVVTQGDYSDYHIVAATTDHELAKKIAAKFDDGYEDCRIEEYGDAEIMTRPAWVIDFDKTGNVETARECDGTYEYSRIGNVYENNSYWGDRRIWVYVSADNLESAIKIAAEKRAKYLAEKLGL